MAVEVIGQIGVSTYADCFAALEGNDLVVRCSRTCRVVGRHPAGAWHEATDGQRHICAVVACPPVVRMQKESAA